MALYIKPGEFPQTIYPKHGPAFTLGEMQALVGGYIEMHELPRAGKYIVINEEGKLKGMAYNHTATKVFTLNGYQDTIVGPALFASAVEVGEGEDYDEEEEDEEDEDDDDDDDGRREWAAGWIDGNNERTIEE